MQISESLHAILHSKDEMAQRFYRRFLTAYPEVQHHFDKVDMHRQGILLTTALIVVERFYDKPTAAVEQYLEYLGTKHHDLKIEKELYSPWTEAMIATLAEFHAEDWDAELEKQWRQAFGRAIETMFRGYERRVTV